ncbi:MAG: hypothetical protein M3O29_00515 [Actinomycetota bacterium]|jgi:hypothetical protein|nr:hypothetical protein [Actinomycetota bacterium]
MADEPSNEATPAEPDEDDWAEEIKRLRAARGDRLAEQLADDTRKDPPVE